MPAPTPSQFLLIASAALLCLSSSSLSIHIATHESHPSANTESSQRPAPLPPTTFPNAPTPASLMALPASSASDGPSDQENFPSLVLQIAEFSRTEAAKRIPARNQTIAPLSSATRTPTLRTALSTTTPDWFRETQIEPASALPPY